MGFDPMFGFVLAHGGGDQESGHVVRQKGHGSWSIRRMPKWRMALWKSL